MLVQMNEYLNGKILSDNIKIDLDQDQEALGNKLTDILKEKYGEKRTEFYFSLAKYILDNKVDTTKFVRAWLIEDDSKKSGENRTISMRLIV